MAHHGLKLGTVTVKLAISLKDTIPEVMMPSYLSSVSDFKVMMPSYFSFVKEFLTLMKKVPKSPMGIDELEELERRRMGDFEGMQHRMEELQGRRGVLHRRPAPAGPPARHLRPPGRPRARHPRPQTRHL